ncbi:MAG: alkaline phosphatase D family protein [Verrucomicrobiota bacterium]
MFYAIRILLLVSGFLPAVITAETPITRVAFGSCCKESRPMPIFEAVSEFQPQVWIWMGDNIYGDTTDMDEMAAKYDLLKSNPSYAAMSAACEVIGTWDDHDFGSNDAGKEYPKRAESQQVFLDFFEVAQDDPRRKREGVYASHVFGPQGQQVKVILLDTRYHRDMPGPDGDILGEAQWQWLEEELKSSSAQVNLLVSSIQVVASDHRFEKWASFPAAKKRLWALLAREGIPPVVLLTGDRHLGEISVERSELSYPVYDITSSSLNAPFGGQKGEVNPRRLGENFPGANFGTLEIDWSAIPPTMILALRNESGEVVRSVRFQQGE